MNITEKILQKTDKLAFLVTEKLKLPAAILFVGGSIALASATGINIAELLANEQTGNLVVDASNKFYASLTGGAIGAAIGAVGSGKILSKLASLASPITSRFNNISNERLYNNFSKVYWSDNGAAKNEKMIDGFIAKASDARFEELQGFLEKQGTTESKKMSKDLWSAYEKKLAANMQTVADSAIQEQTPIGVKVQQKSSKLTDLLAQSGIGNVSSAAYAKEIATISNEVTATVSAAHLTKSFVLDKSFNDEIKVGSVSLLIQDFPDEAVDVFLESTSALAKQYELKLNSTNSVVVNKDMMQVDDKTLPSGLAMR